jgi:hypothetical protein
MKTNSIVFLLVGLIIILAVRPTMVNNIYSSVLGRVVLIAVVIFFAMNNVTLGLLVALTIIAASNKYGSFTEGFESPVTIGEENVPITGSQKVLTKTETEKLNDAKQKISDLKKKADTGVDKEDIKNAIMSKDSKTIQPDPNMMKNEDVNAFTSSMLTNNSTLTEGFGSYSAPVY